MKLVLFPPSFRSSTTSSSDVYVSAHINVTFFLVKYISVNQYKAGGRVDAPLRFNQSGATNPKNQTLRPNVHTIHPICPK